MAGRKALRRESTTFLFFFFFSRQICSTGGGEGKVQSDEGDTAAIFGFLVRMGLVDTESSFLARSRKKPGGRVSESFRGMLTIWVVVEEVGWRWGGV